MNMVVQKQFLSSEKQRRTSHLVHWVFVYPLLQCLQRPLLSSLENVPLGPSVHPVEVVISWMGPRLVDSHHLRMVSSEHSTGSLMSRRAGLPLPEDGRPLLGVFRGVRSQALITARMMVCQKMYTYQRLQLGKRTCLAVPTRQRGGNAGNLLGNLLSNLLGNN
ncbi:hypothetical protein F7725_005050 [Dissostichus mawsoni]|uniref:Uncharacterized protein n=1 Tax=Dissostichus mawsoni TaxID=36200 RepID=A0A7J5XKH1_DISMA|nr:hypothetical protein F7725_005050 [Dissostichus mawsoni]